MDRRDISYSADGHGYDYECLIEIPVPVIKSYDVCGGAEVEQTMLWYPTS